jgi:hypothetical protein
MAEERELPTSAEGSTITTLVVAGSGVGLAVVAAGVSSGISMGTPAPLQVDSTASMVAFWSASEQAFLVQG